MCHYIYVGLPIEVNLKSLRPVIKDHGMDFSSPVTWIDMSPITAGYRFFRPTGRYCDCGTVLGSRLRGESDPIEHDFPHTSQLRHKGWGEAKIARWLSAYGVA